MIPFHVSIARFTLLQFSTMLTKVQLNLLVIICNVYAVSTRKKHIYNGTAESKSIKILK